ncbi:MAG: type I restriction enzyme HsdR N-terminal domain-containing protein, partial [Muribaculaceae bacterium]|nr:type I restriction enzyme HsdR N-terminal domain-containing protein [Muribaculaceae bacterium]
MKLNLPEFDIALRRTADGHLKVADRLRGKFVALTPEEWVRQHFVNFLIEYRGYPPALMANEVGIRHNGNREGYTQMPVPRIGMVMRTGCAEELKKKG